MMDPTGWCHDLDRTALEPAGLLQRCADVREHSIPRPPGEEQLKQWIEQQRRQREQQQEESDEPRQPSADPSPGQD